MKITPHTLLEQGNLHYPAYLLVVKVDGQDTRKVTAVDTETLIYTILEYNDSSFPSQYEEVEKKASYIGLDIPGQKLEIRS